MHKVITFLFLEVICKRNINTFFRQLKIIKLNAIDSTSSYLKDLCKTVELDDPFIVLAEKQTKGRGQMDATWQSQSGKSLTFSVFKRFSDLTTEEHSRITFAVSLGIKSAMEKFNVPGLSIKWPNDIMSYQKKIGGILIESQTKGDHLVSSIIGVGLNVNETSFDKLPHASSMRLETGVNFSIDEVFQKIYESILQQLDLVCRSEHLGLKEEYEASLFRKDMVSVFENESGERFNGIIKGVTKSGQLLLETESGTQVEFRLKELKMLL